MAIHNVSKKDWPKLTWKYPYIHNFEFGFGLSVEDANRTSTIIPYFFQDNALVDFETIKTNPENADFIISDKPNTHAGSYIPKVQVGWIAHIHAGDTEIARLAFDTMQIGTSMLNRLDAFDKKTGNDIETIIELQHETTDEQCGALYNGTKLFEGEGVRDLSTDVPFLTTTGQLEGVAFDKEMFFDAMNYYTNKEMLKLVTNRLRSYYLTDLLVPNGRHEVRKTMTFNTPSLCKFQHPYTYCGEMFNLPQVGSRYQFHLAAQTTGIEHLSVNGFVRFYEFNPDFNFARA